MPKAFKRGGFFRIILNKEKMNILVSILKVAIQVLAGVGIGALADKVAADKLPAYPEGGIALHTDNKGVFNIPRLVYIILAFAVAGILIRFLGRKLKINLLK